MCFVTGGALPSNCWSTMARAFGCATLRLSQGRFHWWPRAETPPAFVDITPSLPWSTAVPGETEIELARPDGARMCIRARESTTPLVALVRVFLEAR